MCGASVIEIAERKLQNAIDQRCSKHIEVVCSCLSCEVFNGRSLRNWKEAC